MTPRPDDPSDRSGDRTGRSDDRSSRKGEDPSRSPAEGSTDASAGDRPDARGRERRPEPGVPKRQRTPVTQKLGRVALVLLAVLFGIFAADNSHSVDFAWVFGESQVAADGTGGVPLIVLLVVAAAIGAALGALIEWQFLRGRRARRADRKSSKRADRDRDRG